MKRFILALLIVITASLVNPVPLTSQNCCEQEGLRNEAGASLSEDPSAPVPLDGTASQRLKCIYYDEKDFYTSIKQLEPVSIDKKGIMLGGIVTHHLLASRLIAQFFSTLSVEKPDTVIVIGPNHKRFGSSPIHTGRWDWDTAFGTVNADGEIVGKVVEELGAHEDYDLLTREHSISSLVPYISFYFPNAEIVPILLHGNLGLERCKKLVDVLEPFFKEKRCLLISSIDFSHYLKPEEAYKMDALTIKAIENRDYETIIGMGNDNLDAPPTLAATLMLMDRLDVSKDDLISHCNSSDLTGVWSESTTSYMTYIFEGQ